MNRRLITVVVIIMMAGMGLIKAAGWIRINQLGYLPDATKVAVLMSQEEVQINGFELVDAFTGQTAYRSTAVRQMGPWGQMQATWRLDFSDFHGEGAYRIVAAGIESPVFPINNRVWDGTADFVLNYMRQQRCGFNPFQRDSCLSRMPTCATIPRKRVNTSTCAAAGTMRPTCCSTPPRAPTPSTR